MHIPHSPLGGTLVAQINDLTNQSWDVVRLSQNILVGNSNSIFQFAYAGFWDQCQPTCCDRTKFNISLYDCNGILLSCQGLNEPSCSSGFASGPYWHNWQVQQIDLSAYIGSCVRVEVKSQDCPYGSHRGVTLFDAKCTSQTGRFVSYCSGSTQAQLTGPLGYSTYTWVAPAGSPIIPASQATLSSITVNSVVASSIYTLNMTNYSGCAFSETYAVVPSSVAIVNTATASSCIGGTSGSATVIAIGSGSGYNYTWTSLSTNSVVSTNSVAVGLAPGIYSLYVTSANGGCGSASSTVAIVSAQQPVGAELKPYCGTKAYFDLPGATNVQWYTNSGAAIAGSLGGTSSSYTNTSPCNTCVVYVSYTSQYGCSDSTIYVLNSYQPGSFSYNPLTESCLASNNGTAVVNIPTSPYAIPGANSFSVWSAGTPSTAYSSSISGSSSKSYAATNLAPGNYNVIASDGFCDYSGQFVINPVVDPNYTLVTSSSTVCSGQTVLAAIGFSLPVSNHYSYSWIPVTFIMGSNNSAVISIQPSISPGPASTIVYSTIVTPTAVFCPFTKTISVTIINTPTPTIGVIPPLCTNSNPFTLNITPPGGVLQSGPGNPIDPLTGIITPSLANIGLNTFSYSISEYTCPVKTTTASYNVNQTISAALNISTLPLLCELNSPLNLMDFALNSAGNWTMMPVAGFTASPLQNNLFYPAGLPTNSYVLTYTTNSNPPGCTDSSTLVVSVLNPPTPSISLINPMCTNTMPVQMVASPPGGIWSGGSYVSLTGEFNPALASAGLNPVQYAVGTGTCSRSSNTNVQLEAFVSAAFIKALGPFCKENAPVDLNDFVLHPGGNWLVDGVALPGSIFDPGVAISSTVSNIVYQTHSIPTASLCPDASTVMVEVRSLITPAFENLSTKACAPVEVTLSAQDIQGAIGTWSFNDGSPNRSGFVMTRFFGQAGTYNVTYEYTDELGCKSPAKTKQIIVHTTPKANFTFTDEIYTYDPRALMTNLSLEADSNSYYWLLDMGLKSTAKNPMLEFSSAGIFSVTLIANSLFDCRSEITRLVTVKNDFAVFIPNSFSPNADGLNDVFLPVFTKDALEAESYQIEIFDRWGHSIFKSTDPDSGWNGSFHNKGESVKTGTYVYLMSYRGADGKTYKKNGHISLLK